MFPDIPALVDFFEAVPEYDADKYCHKKMKTTPEIAKTALAAALEPLRALPEWSAGSIHDCLLGVVAALGMKNGQVLWPVRIAISGLASTPGGATEIALLLGQAETCARIEKALAAL